MLGREREKELLAEAERLRALPRHRLDARIRAALFVIGSIAAVAVLLWLGPIT